MARPRLGESETKRVQLVITEEELTAIENWRFDKRIPSKSEAIRRLCQIGLFVDLNLGGVTNALVTLREHLTETSEEAFALWMETIAPEDKAQNPDRKGRGVAIDKLLTALSKAGGIVDDASEVLVGTHRVIDGLTDIQDIRDRRTNTETVIKDVNESVEKSRKIRGQMDEERRKIAEINGLREEIGGSGK